MQTLPSILSLSALLALGPLASAADHHMGSGGHWSGGGHAARIEHGAVGRGRTFEHGRAFDEGGRFHRGDRFRGDFGVGIGVTPYGYGYDDSYLYGDVAPYADYYGDYTVSPPVVSTYSYSTSIGDPTVAMVQQRLADMGYAVGGVDGEFGPATSNAIARFQTDQGMVVTGNIDNTLLLSLGISR